MSEFQTGSGSSLFVDLIDNWPGSGLGPEMLQVSRGLRIDHLPISTGFAKVGSTLEESPVTAFEKVALRVVEGRIAVAVTVTILVAQETHPTRKKNRKTHSTAPRSAKKKPTKW